MIKKFALAALLFVLPLSAFASERAILLCHNKTYAEYTFDVPGERVAWEKYLQGGEKREDFLKELESNWTPQMFNNNSEIAARFIGILNQFLDHCELPGVIHSLDPTV